MKISFLNPQANFDPADSFWAEHPDFGGQLVYVKEIAASLSRLGHSADILTRQIIDPDWPQFSSPFDAYPDLPGVRIIRIPCGPKRFLPKEELWPWLLTEWVPNILKFYQQTDGLPDVFTAHYADGGSAGAELKKLSGIPFTFTGHSLGAQKMDKLGAAPDNLEEFSYYQFPTRLQAERRAMEEADRIIVSTSLEASEQYTHKYYASHVSIPEDKFAVIPPGVNIGIFSPEESDADQAVENRINRILEDLPVSRQSLPSIFSASRLDKKKNLDGLIKAYAESASLRQSSNLIFAVRGVPDDFSQSEFWDRNPNSFVQELGRLRTSLGLEDSLTAVPLNSQNELAAAYRWAAGRRSVFVLPALYEPFGLAQLEAMACGLPAAATKNGGPSESMLENGVEYGRLIDPEDTADIASGLLDILSSEQRWTAFRDRGVERIISKYTWNQTAKGYEDVFKKLTNSN